MRDRQVTMMLDDPTLSGAQNIAISASAGARSLKTAC